VGAHATYAISMRQNFNFLSAARALEFPVWLEAVSFFAPPLLRIRCGQALAKLRR